MRPSDRECFENVSKNLKNNLLSQTFYEVLNTILPLITTPYLARVLGAEKQGVFSYTQAIVDYFILFAMLGIVNHGIRYMAEQDENRLNRSRAFSEVFSIQLVTVSVMTLLYVLYLVFFCTENRLIALLQIISLVACYFDITWLFLGLEQFKSIVGIKTLIRIVTVILFFLFVRAPEDLWIYTLILTGGVFVANFVLLRFLPRYIDNVKPTWQRVKANLKPVLVLFIPLLAMSFYQIMDKAMLGALSDYKNTGFYYNVEKLINVPLGVILAVSTALFPFMVSVLRTEGDDRFDELFGNCMEGIILVSSVMMFGIAAVAKEFVPLFFGSEFEPCVSLTIVMAPAMMLKAISATIRYQYLVPRKMDNVFIISVSLGALTNVIANYILIPELGALGAVYGTLIAEFVACVSQIVFMQKKINVMGAIFRAFPYMLMGLTMYAAVRIVAARLDTNPLVMVLVEVFAGAAVFIALCLIYWSIFREKTVLDVFIKAVFPTKNKKDSGSKSL